MGRQIESAQATFETGGTIAHCHLRNDNETPSSDLDKFVALKEGLEQHCPGMIVPLSTGGRSGAGRHAALAPRYGQPVSRGEQFSHAGL